MKHSIFALIIGVFGLMAAMGLDGRSTPAEAGSIPPPAEWPPISETCNDVTGDGKVDLFSDIVRVIDHAGTEWGDDDYALLYDTAGGGKVELFSDILGTIAKYDSTGAHGPVEYGGDGSNCPLLDTQLIRSAAALIRYQDCQDADGYETTGVYVPDMGIHITKLSNLSNTFDPEAGWDGVNPESATDLANPFGLVCSIDESWNGQGAPPVGKLIGPWYIVPNQSTGSLYEPAAPIGPPYLPDEVPPDATPPDGFATDADYYDYNPDPTNGGGFGEQAAWHTHINLCVQPGSLSELGPGATQQDCPNGILIENYGWMLHLYNFVPNTDGSAGDPRFSRWNRNGSFPVCGYSTSGSCAIGGAGIAGEGSDIEFGGGVFVCPILSPTVLEKLTQ